MRGGSTALRYNLRMGAAALLHQVSVSAMPWRYGTALRCINLAAPSSWRYVNAPGVARLARCVSLKADDGSVVIHCG